MINFRKNEREIEVKGHLIDSMILTRIFDKIMDMDGDFEVLEFSIGKKKEAPSYAKLLIKGKSEEHLEQLIEEVYREGAVSVSVEDVILEEAPRDMVMPDNFYSSTNNPTFIHQGRWIKVEKMMMDKCIVYDPVKKIAYCKPIRDVRQGDFIAVGEKGVMVSPPERPREGIDVFQFMSSNSSSERPTQHIARKVAQDIYNTKSKKGKIVVVGGPAIVHTGASESLAKLIRMGYVDGLFAGNALAVHDIEYSLMGTSLGMYINDGTLAVRGHRNHMRAVNEVFKAGSISDMVKKGILKHGIMYECIRNSVPYVLAASLRDDGPIPDCIVNVVEAQEKHRELLKGTDMVLMLCTMLHSIAVGNMLHSKVKVVAVDISQPVVTKMLDRGTWQALGIVSDVGSFLPMVVNHLETIS